jgi:hypothetical protein
MMTEPEKIEKNNTVRNARIRVIFLIIYLFILIYLYSIFVNIGVNPIVAFLILLFFFVIVVGPVFSGLSKSLYSRMFTDKKRKARGGYQQYKENLKKESKIPEFKPRKIRPVNLDITYRKPLIAKCSYCGMTVAGFVKKCPKCGELI